MMMMSEPSGDRQTNGGSGMFKLTWILIGQVVFAQIKSSYLRVGCDACDSDEINRKFLNDSSCKSVSIYFIQIVMMQADETRRRTHIAMQHSNDVQIELWWNIVKHKHSLRSVECDQLKVTKKCLFKVMSIENGSMLLPQPFGSLTFTKRMERKMYPAAPTWHHRIAYEFLLQKSNHKKIKWHLNVNFW